MTAEPTEAPVAVSADDRPRRRSDVAAAELDGEVVLLDPAGQVHLLNPPAGLLWACFDGRGTVAEIATDVADAFGVPVEDVQAEVLSLAEDLVGRGLLALAAARDEVPKPDPPDPEDPVIVQPGGY